MKHSLLAGAAVAALFALAAPASAADLPVAPIEPVYVPPAVLFSWTGLYVGVNAGYAWSDIDLESDDDGFFDFDEDDDFTIAEDDGFLLGAQIGYNQQINQFVVGVEADFQWLNLGDDDGDDFGELFFADVDGVDGGAVGFDDDEFALFTGLGGTGDLIDGDDDDFETGMDWFGTVRARAGFALDRFMPYVTGGLAYGESQGSWNIDSVTFEGDPTDGGADDFTVDFEDDDDDVDFGYVVGAGVEGAITDNLTAKVEYLYVDLGSNEIDFSDGAGGEESFDVETNAHILRAGLNLKFNSLFGGM